MLYEIRALAPNQQINTLTVDATSEEAARQLILASSSKVLSVRAAQRSRQHGRVSLLLFSQELLALTDAGLSIIESLDSLSERRADAAASNIAKQLASSLRQGKRLSQALAELPSYFPPVYVGVVQAAETTSSLSDALSRYVVFEQRLGQLKSKTISAAIYPSILLIVGGAVTLFLLGYVVPRFASVYEDTGRSMSSLTSLLLTWGRFVEHHIGLLFIIAFTCLLAAIMAIRSIRERGSMTDIISRIPMIGQQARHFELSRMYMTLGILLSGGVSLTRALQMILPTVGAKSQTAIKLAIRRISSGESFSSATAAERLATDVALRLFKVGERAGNLNEMLMRAASFYDNEIGQFIDRFTKMAEPVLMTAIGVIVGTIVVLLYMPIFELAGSLQ